MAWMMIAAMEAAVWQYLNGPEIEPIPVDVMVGLIRLIRRDGPPVLVA